MSKPEYRNWRLDYDLDKVCWLTIDREGESSNSLSQDVLTELEQIVTHLEANHPKGLVLQSGKRKSFIVGADVREFDQVSSVEEAEGFIRDVHRVFDRIEALPRRRPRTGTVFRFSDRGQQRGDTAGLSGSETGYLSRFRR